MSKLKYHKVFTYDHIHSREISELYISAETPRGQLFVILELPKHKIDQQPLVDEIIKKIDTHFVNLKEDNPEILLEEILQKINEFLPELSTSVKIKNWLNTLAMAVGIMYENNIYLASVGNINALLIHLNQVTPIIEKNPPVNPTKIFSDIISGQLDAGDTLIVSTESLFDYISREKIKQLVKKYSPESAGVKLNELLSTVPDFVTFNSLFMKHPSSSDVALKPEQMEIIEDEEATDDILEAEATITDHHIKPAKTKLVLDLGAVKNINGFNKLKFVGRAIAYFLAIDKKIIIFIASKIKYSILFIFSPRYRRSREAQTLDTIKSSTDHKYMLFQNLSIKKKIAVIILFVIILLFLQSLVFITQQRADKQQTEAYNQLLRDANIKFTEVDTKLIYNDEPAAETILLEIQDMINNVRASSQEQQAKLDELTETVFNQLNKVRHIHVVPSPAEIYNLSDTLIRAQQIVQKEGKFYILDIDKLYVLENENLSSLIEFKDGKYLADWAGENKLLLGNEEQYFIFNIDNNNLESFDFTKTAGNTSVQDMFIYSNNLYVLDSDNNQIFKYAERGDSFSNGSPWLSTDIDLSSTNSFTIDGSIYTIDNNGHIKNFLKGSRAEFDYHQPHPVIGSEATIQTFKDSNYLYIIDPSNKRVIILSKDGEIKDQYTSQLFNNLTDLAIDPEEKAVYLLNGNHLYLLAIND